MPIQIFSGTNEKDGKLIWDSESANIKELNIPSSAGFCKRCFRPRRHDSAYCGECRNEPERMKIYVSDGNFPLVDEAMNKFDIADRIDNIAFTYGDTIYAKRDLSFGLVAHEIIHIIQQKNIGKDIWWRRFLNDFLFRLEQEVEAYRNQYRVYKLNDPVGAEVELERIAQDLSGKMYGNIVDFDRAKELINQF